MIKGEWVFCRNVNFFFFFNTAFSIVIHIICKSRGVIKKAYTTQIVIILRILLGRLGWWTVIAKTLISAWKRGNHVISKCLHRIKMDSGELKPPSSFRVILQLFKWRLHWFMSLRNVQSVDFQLCIYNLAISCSVTGCHEWMLLEGLGDHSGTPLSLHEILLNTYVEYYISFYFCQPLLTPCKGNTFTAGHSNLQILLSQTTRSTNYM